MARVKANTLYQISLSLINNISPIKISLTKSKFVLWSKLLPGFRFWPSDQELITYYLKPRILGQKMASNIINYIELYGRNSTPWKLFDVKDDESWTDSPGKPEKFLYVFTTLSKSRRCSESSKARIRENMRKKAGCGTWVAKTKRKLIRDWKSDDVIGEQRLLVFEINDTRGQFDLGQAGYFKMHEYSLAGVNKGIKAAGGDDIVLCKITFDSSKSPVFKLGFKSIDYAPTNRGGGEPKEQHEKEENLERSVGEGTSNLTPSVVDMNIGFGNNVEATSEHMFVMDDSGISNSYNCVDADQFDNGWDPDFTDWFTGMLNSNPEEWAIEDISNLGKRKFEEEENFCGSKKICL